MTYRKDIDGLRAIAVLAVILYHLDFTFTPGGFIGVDIFFVISGFLITQTIQKDIQENKFTISHFYVKRIRRIIPALFVTTLVTIFFSLLILPINELTEFALSVVSVATFTSNIFFWKHVDYFSVAAELKPLLHTWSLGIEEQFYILFPIFMWLTKKISHKKIILLILLFLLISFTLSASLLASGYITENFFLPITRFWEIFMGSALALSIKYISHNNKVINNFTAFIGLLLILFPMLVLNQNNIFSGMNGLYSVLGATLIIYTGAQNRTYVSSFLSNKYLQYIGLISFSLYLWHWPIIALSKNIIFGEFSLLIQLSILVLTFVLSAISYQFVEQPFRQNEKLKNFLSIKTGLLALLLLAIISSLIYIVVKINFPEKQISYIEHYCFKTEETLESTYNCSFGAKDSDSIFFLYADSHASTVRPAFEKLALENRWRVIVAEFGGCPPLFDVFRLDNIGSASNCTGEYSKNVEHFLENNKEKIELVFLASRWSLFEKGLIINGRLNAATHFISDKEIKSKDSIDSSKVLQKAIIRTVDKITHKLNIQTILLAPVPVLYGDITKQLELKNVTKEDYKNQRQLVDHIFNSFETNSLVKIMDPIDVFCPTDICRMYDDNNDALYLDDNHLSYEGSLLLYPLLKSTLEKKNWRTMLFQGTQELLSPDFFRSRSE
ncbi:MAG: acyltransferase family protein [Methyloprofundus sp.]|nr:acyltransferase family protein [Methyloprofundus sp.]